jgi:hypothetical protein
VRITDVVYEDKRLTSTPHTAAAGVNWGTNRALWQVRMPAEN